MNGMLTQSELRALITGRSTSFAVGVRGVIAEFHWAGDERIEHDDGALEIATALGALAIRMRGDEGLTSVSAHSDGHDHGHGAGDGHDPTGNGATRVCWLPEGDALLSPARGLTELGDDDGAVRAADREQRLFDLGLGLGHVRACVRTADTTLLSVLREHQGENVLERGHPAMTAIKAHGPHRVFESASARIEVFQPIPSRARRERTPDGPHTHVLPSLIGTPDAIVSQLPHGMLPVLTLYPAH